MNNTDKAMDKGEESQRGSYIKSRDEKGPLGAT